MTADGQEHLILGISGASGARIGLRALALFSLSPEINVLHVVATAQALVVARDEISPAIARTEDLLAAAGVTGAQQTKVRIHRENAIDAPISSGSFRTRGMAILPCSSGTLASVAHGVSRGLLQRAADVCLKERRRLILGLRESPYSEIHAENILKVTRAGGIVAPPVPAFYAAHTADEFLDAYLLRVADLLGISIPVGDFRWKANPRKHPD